MAKIQKPVNISSWWQCWVTRTLIYCWLECKMVEPLWETLWQFLTMWSSNCTLRYIPNWFENVCLCMNVYSSCIYNHPKLEATIMPFNRWVNAHPDKTTILFSNKNKRVIKPEDMDESEMHIANWKNSVWKWHKLCNSNYVTF